MKIKIINTKHNDSLILEGNLEEIRTQASEETRKRGWKDDDCYSEKIED